MTLESARTHMNGISERIRKSCRNARQAKRCAERYANKHNLKFKGGEPAIIYEPGSERAILISVKPNGGIHMDIATSPVYAILDQFDSVIFAG